MATTASGIASPTWIGGRYVRCAPRRHLPSHHNLLGIYAENADERDAELFAHASVTFTGTALLGRHGINAHYEALFVAAPRCRHLLTNIIIDIIDIIDVTGAEQAAARCRYSRWSLDTDVTLIARHPPPSPRPLVIRVVRSRAPLAGLSLNGVSAGFHQ